MFPENKASRALLRSLGFREVGIYEKHGRLDGNGAIPLSWSRLIGPTWVLYRRRAARLGHEPHTSAREIEADWDHLVGGIAR